MLGMEKLHLEDAFEDGPQTRNLLTLFETDALMLRNYVVSLSRHFSRFVLAQEEMCAATQSLSAHLKAYDRQSFPLESDESILSSTLSQFAVFLDELSSVHQVLLTQLNDSTMFPVNKFLQSDLDEILTLKEVFHSASEEHERSLAVYMRYPKKKQQDKARQEVINDLYVARKKFHQTTLHYYTALNCLQYKRKSALLEPLIGLLNAQKTFVEIGREAIVRKDVEDFVGNITASVQSVQEELKQATQRMTQQIELIETQSIHRYYAEPLPDMPPIQPNRKLSQKAGYLFLRSKPTLLSTRWDRCYFFIQGGNLMCQTKDEVAGSPLLDLNEPFRIEAVDLDDRRFVFQVVQISSKKTVVLQAENDLERNEWIATIENASKDGLLVCASADMSAGDAGSPTEEINQAVSGVRVPPPSSLSLGQEAYSLSSPTAAGTPKAFDLMRGFASSFGRSSQTASAPSTPSEGTFSPDAPIQFDIIAPLYCDEFRKVPLDAVAANSQAGDHCEITSYMVRFLGSQQVKTDQGEPIVLETVRQIMAARAIYNIFRMTEFELAISSGSIRLLDPLNSNVTAEFALQDISYWAVHNENKRLFGFITRLQDVTPVKSTFTCYVFECNTSGEEICQTIAAATQKAFQLFMQETDKIQSAKEKELLLTNKQKLENRLEHQDAAELLTLDQSSVETVSAVDASTELQQEKQV